MVSNRIIFLVIMYFGNCHLLTLLHLQSASILRVFSHTRSRIQLWHGGVSRLLRTEVLSAPSAPSPEMSTGHRVSCLWQGVWDSRNLGPRGCVGGLPGNRDRSYPASVARDGEGTSRKALSEFLEPENLETAKGTRPDPKTRQGAGSWKGRLEKGKEGAVQSRPRRRGS